ncbi:NAD(P)-dependent oxidoreductase [Myxococcota bacterium]|nr:NAD(P)-dependent oxidoreductase [Myxococcota bacterium]
MNRIAFLGTGLIGSGMIEGALRRGLAVTAWNRTRAKAEALAPLGATIAPDVATAVTGAERVHLALSADDAVDAVLTELAPHVAKGTLVIDHSTTSPARTKLRAERADAAGLAFLHAPVFMSPQACRESTGVMLCAGPRARFEAAEPALAAMTKSLWFVGERPDLAAAYKLFGNTMILTITAGMADMFQQAASLGIPSEQAYALFAKFNPAMTLDVRGGKMARGDFSPSFAMSMARKDVGLMLEAAGDAPLAVLPALAARLDALIAEGMGDLDVGALAKPAVDADDR